MIELKKLAFEKINYTTIKVNKKDFTSLVEKGAELGLDEAQVKKIVVSCLKQARKFKDTDLPLAILEERDISLVAEEMCIPAEVIQSWKNEAEGKLKILESILAVNNQEQLQAFIAENPGMESLTQIPLNQFIKILHKDIDETVQTFVPEQDAPQSNIDQSDPATEEIKSKSMVKKTSKVLLIGCLFLLASIGVVVVFPLVLLFLGII